MFCFLLTNNFGQSGLDFSALDFIALTSLTSDVYPKLFHIKDTYWEIMDVGCQNSQHTANYFTGNKATSVIV